MAVLPSPEAQSRQAGLPTPNSTHSYWHRDPSKTLLGHRTTPDLPVTADVVVIGSGISGAFAARELTAGGRRVVMLEAREACWGATGRNGGHCQPAVWDSAAEVARFELATFALVRDLVAAHGIPCDWRVVGGVHAIYAPEVLAAARRQIDRLQAHPDLRDKAALLTDPDELAQRRVPAALAAVFQPNAAKLWPYKLVAWVLESLLAAHPADAFNLQTNTPVTRLSRRRGGGGGGSSSPPSSPSSSSSSSSYRWVVHTPRGDIAARDVLLATNGYTSHLVPALSDVIVPVRGQICALEPPPSSGDPETQQLPHSYVWTRDASDQYLVHRGADDTQVGADEPGTGTGMGTGTTPDRSLILGGERFAAPGGEEGVYADDAVDPRIGAALRRALYGAVRLRPDGEEGGEEEVLRATYEWTGIMGYSRDGRPWVGQVPAALEPPDTTAAEAEEAEAEAEAGDGHGGLWISAAFTGHGMPVAPRCGIAVAEMILGRSGGAGAVEVPAAWTPSAERAAGARLMELPRTLEDLLRSLPAVEE
ncbi:putative FAD dependent oxidoreductase [Rosellinia necatrix]|uniref:Putative FAD dependent oxidoreductase n=1 Tax=Rosellinia necatrix TaxID=77044 RepID=A0A1S8AA31_ROSNE|nr:putative FAD dependent oxidoreductase [Rosellinia necatrix]